jgi:hypothetical protein
MIWTAYLLVHSPWLLLCYVRHAYLSMWLWYCYKRLIPKIVINHYIGVTDPAVKLVQHYITMFFTTWYTRVVHVTGVWVALRRGGSNCECHGWQANVLRQVHTCIKVHSAGFCNPAFIFYWEGVLRMMWCYLQCPIMRRVTYINATTLFIILTLICVGSVRWQG